jgi:hypothetical protein
LALFADLSRAATTTRNTLTALRASRGKTLPQDALILLTNKQHCCYFQYPRISSLHSYHLSFVTMKSAAVLCLLPLAATAFTTPPLTFAVSKKKAPPAKKAAPKPSATKAVVAKKVVVKKVVAKKAPPKKVVKAVVKPVVKKVVAKKVVAKKVAPKKVIVKKVAPIPKAKVSSKKVSLLLSCVCRCCCCCCGAIVFSASLCCWGLS